MTETIYTLHELELGPDVTLRVQVDKSAGYFDLRIFWRGYPSKKGVRFYYKGNKEKVQAMLDAIESVLEDS